MTAALRYHQIETGAVPNRSEYLRLAKDANLIPVYYEMVADTETPVTALGKLGASNCTWLLESVENGRHVGRYSFLGNSAFLSVYSKGQQVTINEHGHERQFQAQDPLAALEAVMQAYRPARVPGLPPFFGGAVGYLSYDIVRCFERLPDTNPDSLNLPDLYFILTDLLLVFDHVRRKMQIVVNTRVGGNPEDCYNQALNQIAATMEKLARPESAPLPLGPLELPQNLPPYSSSFSKTDFMAAVRRCQEYIAAGDAFQIVLSQRLSTPLSAHPFNIYRALRAINPSPYMFYLQFPGVHVVGSSPEILVRAEDGKVILRPIAGTRKRGADAAEDEALAAELLADEKERAEHVMLVDLGRNDLGRVCATGTVSVDEFMTVERYSHVMHMVSNVSGRLAPDKTAFDLLRAAFPAGTVSGAPKIRAMEIIEELEPVKRGLYAGGVGYFGFNGNMDVCITIRTVVACAGAAHVQAGAGIVADSNPEREYEETLAKAQAVLRAVQAAATACA